MQNTSGKTVLIIEEDDRLRVILTMFMEDLKLRIISTSSENDLDQIISPDTSLDYLLHRGNAHVVADRCFEITGRILKILPPIDFSASELPALNELRNTFLRAV